MKPIDLDLLDAWQYHLPTELIASRPTERREDARLLVIERSTGVIRHQTIRDLPELLQPGDLMVMNNTKVLPARLFGFRTATGGKWEGLFVEQRADGLWNLLSETRGRLQPGETVTVFPGARIFPVTSPTPDGAAAGSEGEPAATLANLMMQHVPRLTLTLSQKQPDGSWLATADDVRDVPTVLDQFGSLPLPPYMNRRLADADDTDRYQTQFASRPGAVAAPTAGLHFTPELLTSCQQKQIARAEVTLHVGIGTFRPVATARLSEHDMHSEWCELPATTCDAIGQARLARGRIVAVGTTTVRTLESAPFHSGVDHATNAEVPAVPQPFSGDTRLFIQPGFRFRVVDVLLTNFHLPGSTLLVLVAAFAGYELMHEAYRVAVAERYRFYSYGDAMLIL